MVKMKDGNSERVNPDALSLVLSLGIGEQFERSPHDGSCVLGARKDLEHFQP